MAAKPNSAQFDALMRDAEHKGNLALARLAAEGLPPGSVAQLAAALSVSQRELTEIVNIPERTLLRRQRTGTKLNPDESAKILRVGRLLQLAARIFENRPAAIRWFTRPLRILGGNTPLSVCATEFGAREVEQALERIDHGVFA